MIKRFMYVILIFSAIIIIKFFMAGYNISYKVGKYNVKEIADRDIMYFEIDYEGTVYNYMFYNARKLTKKRVRDVEVSVIDDAVCLKPVIKGMESYLVCHDGNTLVSENVLKEVNYNFNNSDDFYYGKNLSKDEYVLIWKYNGFYYMNAEDQRSINIFNKDRYSNDLMYQKDKYLIFPNYGDSYLFSDFVILDMVKGEYKTISTDYKINYNSKVVGEHNASIYVFDYTSNKLYEINYKKRKCKLVGDEIKGYIKYEDGKKKSASLDDYVKNKYTFFDNESKYVHVDKNYFSYNISSEISFKYFGESDVRFVDSFDDNIYFLSKDNLLRYNRNKIEILTHYFEFNFNNGDIVFVYNK